jgi:nickel superoxide dismutase
MSRIVKIFELFFPSIPVYAHCDIPCGIYDTHEAQVAAHSVLRMTQLITEAHEEKDQKILMHNISRYTRVKEEHAEKIKHEVRVIWADYFKPEMIKEYPDLHEKVFLIMKSASKTRQSVDLDSAQDLLDKVQEFAEIFWKTKGRQTVRVASGYPTGQDMVLPK